MKAWCEIARARRPGVGSAEGEIEKDVADSDSLSNHCVVATAPD